MHPLANLSLWHDTMTAEEWGAARPALAHDAVTDVAIVGGGFTGLWTAYYLLTRRPSLRVTILEAEQVGFGASGRNGGWCSALLPMGLDAIAAKSNRDAAIALQRTMNETVAEVGRVVAHEGIDCHWAHGGYVSLARNAVQLERARASVAHDRSYGFAEEDVRLLDAREASRMANATNVVGGTYTPHCAAIHPSRLARGLASAVERLGATIHEGTRVLRVEPRNSKVALATVHTAAGTLRADTVVMATEAFTAQMPGQRRNLVPIYSLMIATEPLPDEVWAEIGLHERATFNDGRRMIIYGQRTSDGRFAFGGRGAPYHFGSRMDPTFDKNPAVHALLHETLREMFPAIGDAKVTHTWGGAVAAARDWWCFARHDRASGIATATSTVEQQSGAAADAAAA
ncbi:MAG: NAD(P)/FAD-dependent oxidoreductase, partial [Ilumatobacteraceae bacterium]